MLSLALSVMLFAGVEKIREGAREGFETTISGTDLIVGAPSGQINLLLFTVFRIGEGSPATRFPDWRKQSREKVSGLVRALPRKKILGGSERSRSIFSGLVRAVPRKICRTGEKAVPRKIFGN